MICISEGALEFGFPAQWDAGKYDGWAFYRRHFQKISYSKAVDILAYDPQHGGTLWMIEVKDYGRNRRMKSSSLYSEITQKVRDTLSGILAAKVRARNLRVVLHLEQPAKTSKLFPRPFNPTDLQLRLESVVKAVDPHPKVVEGRKLHPSMDWEVKRAVIGAG